MRETLRQLLAQHSTETHSEDENKVDIAGFVRVGKAVGASFVEVFLAEVVAGSATRVSDSVMIDLRYPQHHSLALYHNTGTLQSLLVGLVHPAAPYALPQAANALASHILLLNPASLEMSCFERQKGVPFHLDDVYSISHGHQYGWVPFHSKEDVGGHGERVLDLSMHSRFSVEQDNALIIDVQEVSGDVVSTEVFLRMHIGQSNTPEQESDASYTYMLPSQHTELQLRLSLPETLDHDTALYVTLLTIQGGEPTVYGSTSLHLYPGRRICTGRHQLSISKNDDARSLMHLTLCLHPRHTRYSFDPVLHRILHSDDVLPDTVEGPVEALTQDAWRSRWARLKETSLCIYHSKEEFAPQHTFDLLNETLQYYCSTENGLDVLHVEISQTGGKSYGTSSIKLTSPLNTHMWLDNMQLRISKRAPTEFLLQSLSSCPLEIMCQNFNTLQQRMWKWIDADQPTRSKAASDSLFVLWNRYAASLEANKNGLIDTVSINTSDASQVRWRCMIGHLKGLLDVYPTYFQRNCFALPVALLYLRTAELHEDDVHQFFELLFPVLAMIEKRHVLFLHKHVVACFVDLFKQGKSSDSIRNCFSTYIENVRCDVDASLAVLRCLLQASTDIDMPLVSHTIVLYLLQSFVSASNVNSEQWKSFQGALACYLHQLLQFRSADASKEICDILSTLSSPDANLKGLEHGRVFFVCLLVCVCEAKQSGHMDQISDALVLRAIEDSIPDQHDETLYASDGHVAHENTLLELLQDMIGNMYQLDVPPASLLSVLLRLLESPYLSTGTVLKLITLRFDEEKILGEEMHCLLESEKLKEQWFRHLCSFATSRPCELQTTAYSFLLGILTHDVQENGSATRASRLMFQSLIQLSLSWPDDTHNPFDKHRIVSTHRSIEQASQLMDRLLQKKEDTSGDTYFWLFQFCQSNSLQNSAASYLDQLHKLHLEQKRYPEAAMCYMRYLKMTQFSAHSLTSVQQLTDLMLRAKLPEYAIDFQTELIKDLDKKGKHAECIPLHKSIDQCYRLSMDYFSGKEYRMFGEYYRISFYGPLFKEKDSVSFVYKEKDLVRLTDIKSYLSSEYEPLLGEKPTILFNRPVKEDERGKHIIQINSLSPHVETESSNAFQVYSHIEWFTFSTPFTKSGKAQGSTGEQYKRKTFIRVPDGGFPALHHRLCVLDSYEQILTPIQNATDDIRIRNAKLYQEFHPVSGQVDHNSLNQLLSGSVCVQVNAGIGEVCEIFLNDAAKLKLPRSDIVNLTRATKAFFELIREGLRLSASMASTKAHLELQSEFQKGYSALQRHCKPYLE